MNFSHFVWFGLILIFSEATLSPKSPKGNKVKTDKTKIGPQNYTVFSKNLVVEEPNAKDIINHHQGFFREVDEFSYPGLVLGYVTPWNNHGYDIAKIFGNKFTHISPVWLQVKRKGTNKYKILGTHDVDEEWMVAVRNAGRERKVKIVPRILFDGWNGIDYHNIITDQKELAAMIDTFIKVAEKYKFGGFVLEVWSQLASVVPFDTLVDLIKNIANALGEQNLETILVIPPFRRNEGLFSEKHFDALFDYVTAFSLMTYDFSNAELPGPNAPLQWVEKCITLLTSDRHKRTKILTGLNFYGNDYSTKKGSPIIAHEYIDRLKKFNGKLEYDPKYAESYFKYRDAEGEQHVVFYPTLDSISKRLEMCRDLNTGVSIWELGQGLDYFYDLL